MDVEMSLTINGEVRSSGTGAACLGDPLEALRWLAVQCHRFGDPLRAGQVVLSGALGPFVPFALGTGRGVHQRVRAAVRRVRGVTTVGKRTAAIVGPGNIGTDLMCVCQRRRGRDRAALDDRRRSDQRGSAPRCRARAWSPATRGRLAAEAGRAPDLIFEATSAYVHREYAPRYEEAGIRAVDLTRPPSAWP